MNFSGELDILSSFTGVHRGKLFTMKLAPRWFLCLILSVACSAAEKFPGLQAVLTPAEWQRAGLDRLSPDELGVIDAALIRQQAAATTQLQTALVTARATAAAVAIPAPMPLVQPKAGWLQRFGLPAFDDSDRRTLPPLVGTVVKWESANRFRLDNGQVWEGFEPITYELVGKSIEIHARPHGQFVLVIDGQSTTLRLMRLR